jgi:hypothetical protein
VLLMLAFVRFRRSWQLSVAAAAVVAVAAVLLVTSAL